MMVAYNYKKKKFLELEVREHNIYLQLGFCFMIEGPAKNLIAFLNSYLQK